MNIFIRELKVNKWSLLFWAAGMLVFVWAGVMKFSAYEASGQNMNQIINQIPKSVQIIVGINVGADVSTARGFYGVLFFYLVLIASAHAALLGAGIISKEERDRTSEFLFVKPTTRTKIVTAKLLAALCNVIVLNLVTLVSSVWLMAKYNKGASATHDIILLMGGMFFLQLIFLSLGAAIAGILKKPKGAASLTAGILLFTFILSVFVDVYTRIENLKYLTPFKYFDAKSIMQAGKLDPFYIILSVAIVAVLIFSTYYFYSRRDLEV